MGYVSLLTSLGLNDCIAYHEVGHAVVAKFLPGLASFILATDGIKSDPGAMVCFEISNEYRMKDGLIISQVCIVELLIIELELIMAGRIALF